MNTEKERSAEDAINQFLQYSCVFLVPGSEGGTAKEVGSGVIIRTKGAHFVILTAKHVAENAQREEYRLGFFECSNPLPDFVAGVLPFPDDVDVALLVVKRNLASALDDIAVPQDSVPIEEADILDGDSLVLNGFPAQIVQNDEGKRVQGFTVLTYWCCPENISNDKRRRYRLEWKDATVWRGEKAFDLPSPQGMSGGPLWRFRKPASTSIWSPGQIGKIIGVQSAWDRKETAIIEPADKWRDWFHASLLTIDNTF
jgi:Trypsin-like peptidase domain